MKDPDGTGWGEDGKEEDEDGGWVKKKPEREGGKGGRVRRAWKVGGSEERGGK